MPGHCHKDSGNYYKLIWDYKAGLFSIKVNDILLYDKESIREKFAIVPSLDEINRCDRVFSHTEVVGCTEKTEETEAKPIIKKDWSRVHTPSKAFEQPSIKEKIEKLK